MKKRGVIIALVLILFVVASFICFYLKKESDKQAILSAEYAYTTIFIDAKILLDNINEQNYSNPDEAHFKTDFILGQIDLKTWKKDIEKCLLDNGISYDRVEEEELINKCEKPFIEQIINLAKESPLDEDKIIEALIAHDLAQMPIKSSNKMTELGFSEAAVAMAPIIAYTRVDIYGCIKKAKNCMYDDKSDGSKAILDECLRICYSDYINVFNSVLREYEYSTIKF